MMQCLVLMLCPFCPYVSYDLMGRGGWFCPVCHMPGNSVGFCIVYRMPVISDVYRCVTMSIVS